MGLLVPECYVTRTNGSLTAAAQHLRARLYLRSLRARNRSGFASRNHGESQLLLHQQLQHQLLTLKGQYDVFEMQARPSWGTTRPAESPNRQLQLLHWVQLMLLLQCCARILQDVRASHEDVHALDREQHRHAVVRRRSPGSEIGGTATPRPAQRSRQPAWQASHPAFCGRGGAICVRNWYAYAGLLMYPGGVIAPAPAETADCTHYNTTCLVT